MFFFPALELTLFCLQRLQEAPSGHFTSGKNKTRLCLIYLSVSVCFPVTGPFQVSA